MEAPGCRRETKTGRDQRGYVAIVAESGENVNPPLVVVQTRLKELGCEFGSGQDWQCPAHDDLKASLGVKASVDGKVLLNCQAGCTTEEVVKALKLEWTDLFPKKRPEVAYTYTDEENRLLFQVVKTSKGDRYARRPADAFAFSALAMTTFGLCSVNSFGSRC